MTQSNKPDVFIERDTKGAPRGLGVQIKLILRLLRDGRVNPLLKTIPVVALLYFILPLPLDNLLPVIDDAVVIGLGMYTFVELCPQDVVAEHRAAIAAEAGKPA